MTDAAACAQVANSPPSAATTPSWPHIAESEPSRRDPLQRNAAAPPSLSAPHRRTGPCRYRAAAPPRYAGRNESTVQARRAAAPPQRSRPPVGCASLGYPKPHAGRASARTMAHPAAISRMTRMDSGPHGRPVGPVGMTRTGWLNDPDRCRCTFE